MGQYYWPPNVPRTFSIDSVIQAYATRGFRRCAHGDLEEGIEKIAIYGTGPSGAERPTHAALQLLEGRWTSKLGNCEDVTHSTANDVNGPCYGQVLCFLGRPRH